MLFNMTNVGKVLRYSSELFWTIDNDMNIISDGHFILQLKDGNDLLVKIFGKRPGPGETLRAVKEGRKHKVNACSINFSVWLNADPDYETNDTRMSCEALDRQHECRIFEAGGTYIMINREFFDMVTGQCVILTPERKKNSPVYFIGPDNEKAIILPVNYGSKPNSYLVEFETWTA